MAVGNLGGGQSRLSLQAGNEPIPGLMEFLEQFEQSLSQSAGARESAGRTLAAKTEGAANLMTQATEKAGEGYDFKTHDVMLAAAAVAAPIIAALLPEGKGRRGRRKSDRMRGLVGGLGGAAGKGLGYRMDQFEEKQKLGYEAAEAQAKAHIGAAETEYRGKQRDIQAGETGQYRRAQLDLAGQREQRLGLPKADKGLSPSFLYRVGRDAAADKRRETKEIQTQALREADTIWRALPFASETESYDIKSPQDLNAAISQVEHLALSSPMMRRDYQNIAQQLKRIRDQYFGGGLPMLPGGGQGLGTGEVPLTPEEKAELEARRQRQ
ncbi:MAG: hypothetical protein ACYTF1_25890 [Planctomycetota bacterium]|jgi:hypothetical protein